MAGLELVAASMGTAQELARLGHGPSHDHHRRRLCITITAGGGHVLLQVEPTKPLPAEPLRYVTMAAPAVPAIEFDTATGHFIEQVLAKLSDDHIEETNLSRIWAELREERANPEISLFRKFEALLGADPGEADADAVQGK
jgi:hypothetical protein